MQQLILNNDFESDNKTHLLNLSQKDCLPANHFKYLEKLKASGFEPKVIYDIGSCVLHWTKKAKLLWPNSKIILFDAFREAEFLYEGYDYHMGVLTDEDNKELKFYKNIHSPGGNSYYKENNDRVFPSHLFVLENGMTLDTIVKEKGFPLPDLIKMDVQGAEKDIIIGAPKCLANAKHLICEIQSVDYNMGAPKVKETLPFIEALGWKCVAPKFCDNGPDADYGFVNTK